MRINPRTIADFFRLGSVPGTRKIFLRLECDRFGGVLQSVAGVYRRAFLGRTRIVAVIGSLGKTTARHAVATALDCSDRHFSYSNYGFSLAENLLRVRPRDRFAVIEAGIAGPGRMASYGRMIRPDIVVVTSIKSEHNRSFATLQETRAEKVKMVRALAKSGTAILNCDDENVRWMATQTGARVLTFGLNSENAVRAEKVVFGEDGRASFEVRIGGKTFPVHIRCWAST